MKVYIAGPMSGQPMWNFPAFDAMSERLKAAGHDPVSPADLDRLTGFDPTVDPDAVPTHSMRDIMRRDLLALLECHAIIMLRGWPQSEGAKVERMTAQYVGLTLLDTKTLEKTTW